MQVSILEYSQCVGKTFAETRQQIAVPHGIPSISGKRQPPIIYIYYISYNIIYGLLYISIPSAYGDDHISNGLLESRPMKFDHFHPAAWFGTSFYSVLLFHILNHFIPTDEL